MKRIMAVCFTVFLVVMTICAIERTDAAYLPDGAFMARFTALLENAPVNSDGENLYKELSVGKTFKNGDVAYAVISSEDGFYLQLEEYRLQENGSFLIHFWRFLLKEAVHWIILASQNEREWVLGITEIPIASEDAIAKSERAQELLRHFGEQKI